MTPDLRKGLVSVIMSSWTSSGNDVSAGMVVATM